jgi:hypothetical protein
VIQVGKHPSLAFGLQFTLSVISSGARNLSYPSGYGATSNYPVCYLFDSETAEEIQSLLLRRGVVASKSYKDRLIVVSSERDARTRLWKPTVQIIRRFDIDGEFDSQEAADDAAMTWAVRWVNKRQN